MTRWIGVAFIIIAVGLSACEPADMPPDDVEVIDPIDPDAPENGPDAPQDASATFDALLAEGTPVLAMFESSWSSTARQSELLLAELQAGFPEGIAFILINTDSASDLVDTHAIAEYPTTLLFDHGQEVARWSGPTTQAVLKSDLQQFLHAIAAKTALAEEHTTEINP